MTEKEFSESEVKCQQHKGTAFEKDCKQCWYAWGFDRGFKAVQESKIIPSHVKSDDAARVADEMVKQARQDEKEKMIEEIEKVARYDYFVNPETHKLDKKVMLSIKIEDWEALKKKEARA